MYSEIVDLSILIENNMIYYPGDPEPELSKYITLEEDGCQVMKLNIGTHTGTHMDAPAHFVKNGKTIDNVNLKKCIGKAVVVHLPNLKPYYEIVPEDFNKLEEHIKISSIVLFNTGWIYKAGTEEFYKHPYISKSTAEYLKNLGVKAVGVDMLNVDKTCIQGEQYTENSTASHNIFLGNDILIVENLTNLEKLDTTGSTVMFLPLKIKDGDGSPVRAVAFV